MRKYHWQWPEHGWEEQELLKDVESLGTPYNSDPPPFCYPGTPLRWSEKMQALAGRILSLHINNIGTHTHEGLGEGGFATTQRMEAEAIWMLASMIGGNPDTVDGYFCGGATEANDQGIWIGREYLRKFPDPFNRGICVLTSPLVHYSIHKAVHKMDIGRPFWMDCPRCNLQHVFCPDPSGSGIEFVGLDQKGQMDMRCLEATFRFKYEEGFRRFLIVPTLGTTVMGSIDPVSVINDFVQCEQRSLSSVHFYIHVDAAFGGFTVPFVSPNTKFGFDLPHVMSVAIDADKMGQLPYPSGIFLCRKNLQKFVSRPALCVRGHEDDTFSGSRTSLAPVLAWYQFQNQGIEGQRQYVQQCIEARDRLQNLITERLSWANVLPCSPHINILPVEFPLWRGEIPEKIRESCGCHPQHDCSVLAPYHLRSDFVPSDPGDPNSCPWIVYKLCIMPHTIPFFDQFITDLKRAFDLHIPS